MPTSDRLGPSRWVRAGEDISQERPRNRDGPVNMYPHDLVHQNPCWLATGTVWRVLDRLCLVDLLSWRAELSLRPRCDLLSLQSTLEMQLRTFLYEVMVSAGSIWARSKCNSVSWLGCGQLTFFFFLFFFQGGAGIWPGSESRTRGRLVSPAASQRLWK